MTSVAEAPILPPGHPVPYRFTAEQSLNMAKAAIFGHEDKLELIHGVLFRKPWLTPPDCYAITSLLNILHDACLKKWVVRTQSHIVSSDDGIPSPDVSVAQGSIDDYREFFPTAAQTVLVVEVSGSSSAFDLGVKLALYAAAMIPEYWVVDLPGQRLHVHTLPRVGDTPCYRSVAILGIDDEVPLTLRGEPFGSIRVGGFLPPLPSRGVPS